jgi:hypothetical protein
MDRALCGSPRGRASKNWLERGRDIFPTDINHGHTRQAESPVNSKLAKLQLIPMSIYEKYCNLGKGK